MSRAFWTPEMDAHLTRLWNEGWSTRQIAAFMEGFAEPWNGAPVTRNSVIGRARRLGLRRHQHAPQNDQTEGLVDKNPKAYDPIAPKLKGCQWIHEDPRDPSHWKCGAPVVRGSIHLFCSVHLERSTRRKSNDDAR